MIVVQIPLSLLELIVPARRLYLYTARDLPIQKDAPGKYHYVAPPLLDDGCIER